jgi:general secretion pathway protein B
MSYILEALKKLEQKRRREEGMRLLSDQQPQAHRPKRRPLWPYLISLTLLLNAAFILWWLRPWHQPRSATGAPQPRETVNQDSRSDAVHVLGGIGESGTGSSASSAVKSIPTDQKRFAHETPAHVAAEDGERRSAGTLRSREHGNPQGQQPAVGINELPPSLRLSLPDLTISGHFFDAGSSSRVVIIGGRTLHEGQTVAPGLKLEQITRDGAVFSYQGYRFRENVF